MSTNDPRFITFKADETDLVSQGIFFEKQFFRQWWLWVIMVVPNCLLVYGIYVQVFQHKPFGEHPMGDVPLILTCLSIFLISFLLFRINLVTIIMEEGVVVRLFPFHLKFRKYTWDRISKSYVRKYRPITEYGGWGLRSSLFRRRDAFNIAGNKGLQLEFTDGYQLLIGTQKPEELQACLEKIGHSVGG